MATECIFIPYNNMFFIKEMLSLNKLWERFKQRIHFLEIKTQKRYLNEKVRYKLKIKMKKAFILGVKLI